MKMSNELTKKPTNTGLSTTGDNASVLNELMKTLPPEQRKLLAQKAIEARIEAEENERAAKFRHDASTVEMVRHVDLVKEHEKIKSDYTINSSIKTATGETHIKVSKSNNMTFIVIAVVVAIVFFVMFSK